MSAKPAHTGPLIPEWTLADRLRKVRRHTGMSQAEIADLLGTNQRTYAAWESEQSRPRNVVAVAKRIELVTHVPAAWVLGIDLFTPSQTHGYRNASSTAAASLLLVNDTPGIYRAVDCEYRSSAPEPAYVETATPARWSARVNNAHTA